MKPKLNPANCHVAAACPDCGVMTTFELRQSIYRDQQHEYLGSRYTRVAYLFNQCATCGRAGIAKIHDTGGMANAVLESFFPFSIDALPLPPVTPAELQKEFREAEQCASFGANRAASALFRSTLEKTLKLNGYIKSNDSTLKDLQKRIDAAAADGVITEARKKRAHDDVRALGNDVLHDDWRQVTDDEVDAAHRYTQRVIEDFYDDRPTVEALLIAKGKLKVPPASSAAPPASAPTP